LVGQCAVEGLGDNRIYTKRSQQFGAFLQSSQIFEIRIFTKHKQQVGV